MSCPVCKTGEYEPWSLGAKYCEKHDVCIDCGVSRKGLGYAPWGVRIGAFQCKPCAEKERVEAIAKRRADGFNHEYTSEIVCPYCGYEHSDSWEMSEGEHDCIECGTVFDLERIVTVDYSTTIKETPHDQ